MLRQRTNRFRDTCNFPADFPQRCRRPKADGGQRRGMPVPVSWRTLPGQPVEKDSVP